MEQTPGQLTYGTSGLGRGSLPGTPEEDAAVDVAVDLLSHPGVYVDTSNNYADGRSEAVLGLALKRLDDDAGERVISKVDCDPASGAFDRERVLRSWDETAARLGVDRLPLLHLHDPYTVTFEQSMAPGGAVDGLIELRESGLVGAIGVAAGPAPLMARYVDTGAFDAMLVHNRFTLIDQSAETVFRAAKERGMTVFNAAPFGSGILATGARRDATYHYGPATPALIEWVERVEALCGVYNVPLTALALHFSLRSELVDSTVVGVSSAARRSQLDDLAAVAVPDDIWLELERLGPAPSSIDDSAYL